MKCPRCQHENEAGAKFCEECAAPLARACARCGRQLSRTAKFCPECAHPTEPSTAPPPTERFGSPESYTPKHLAERILTSKAALEGERKQVTVLFADLKGSMELLANRDPEEARKLLDPVLERMMEAVHRYDGTVNQVMGDGIMALFGAPLAHEDHAVRGCYAALRMQRQVNLYADEIQRGGGTPVQIRVGLNSGEVVVRSIGSDLHMDYTAVGQTTHLAARMEQMAKPGSVLVTGETLQLAEGYFQVTPLGPITVKGLESAIAAYELIGVGPARSRLQASAARGLTRFVGRASELQQLTQALERTAAGHGQTVAVVGEAGLGKSRLLWEFTRSRRTHGWLLLESRSVSYGKATPYLPVIELLKAYFRIQDRDDQREIRERVAGKLLMLDKALEPLLTPLLTLLDVPVADSAWDALDPPQRRQRTLAAVRRLILRESQVQPLLLVFEDLHWIDSETQSLLDGLIESQPTARLLLLVSYRPEYQHTWANKSYYLQLRIDPLPPESADELLGALLGEDRTLEPLKRMLIERTDGNPFFLEESVRILVETQMLIGERGAYRMPKTPEQWQIPATAQAILAARIDGLPPEDKRLLQAAAVIGKDVPFTLLQSIAEVSEDSLRQGLTHLQGAEFLYETSLFPDLEYTFKHALTHEVAYGSMLQERRRRLHVRIMEAIEQLYPDRPAEQIERVAHHALRGEVWEKAVTYLRQAGVKAATRFAHREAVTYFEQALGALKHLPQSQDTIEQAVDLRFDLRTSLLALGELERVLHVLREAETIAETARDQRRLAQASSFLANCYYLMGNQDQAIQSGQRALAIATALGDFRLQVGANLYLGLAYGLSGAMRRAIEFFKRNIELLRTDQSHERLGMAGLPVVSRAWLAWALTELGQFSEAIAIGDEAVQIAQAVNNPGSLILAYVGVAYPYFRKGDIQNAIVVDERALRLCQGGDFPFLFPMVAAQLGYTYALAGRFAEAFPLLEQAAKRSAAMRTMAVRSRQVAFLAEAYLLAQRLEDAKRYALDALELARTHKEPIDQALALRLLGEIALNEDPPDITKAEASLRQALGLADELGIRPLMAHCHHSLGKLYRRTDQRQQAEAHLSTATTMFREMDMSFWLPQADAELKSLG
ncbi:MAG: AAA family ATPase [Gaiellales bacterium]